MRRFKNCIHHWISLGWSNQGRWYMWGKWWEDDYELWEGNGLKCDNVSLFHCSNGKFACTNWVKLWQASFRISANRTKIPTGYLPLPLHQTRSTHARAREKCKIGDDDVDCCEWGVEWDRKGSGRANFRHCLGIRRQESEENTEDLLRIQFSPRPEPSEQQQLWFV